MIMYMYIFAFSVFCHVETLQQEKNSFFLIRINSLRNQFNFYIFADAYKEKAHLTKFFNFLHYIKRVQMIFQYSRIWVTNEWYKLTR